MGWLWVHTIWWQTTARNTVVGVLDKVRYHYTICVTSLHRVEILTKYLRSRQRVRATAKRKGKWMGLLGLFSVCFSCCLFTFFFIVKSTCDPSSIIIMIIIRILSRALATSSLISWRKQTTDRNTDEYSPTAIIWRVGGSGAHINL